MLKTRSSFHLLLGCVALLIMLAGAFALGVAVSWSASGPMLHATVQMDTNPTLTDGSTRQTLNWQDQRRRGLDRDNLTWNILAQNILNRFDSKEETLAQNNSINEIARN